MRGWRAVGASVAGTSHQATGKPCQDHHAFGEIRVAGELVFAAVIADGAGSAARSDEGARLVCEQFLIELEEMFVGIESISAFGPEQLDACWKTTRLTLADHAATEGADLADFASTLLTAIVLPDRVLVAQIGDGAIVLGHGGAYRVAIWPQQGEFANTTNFLTGRGWEERRQMLVLPSRCDALVMFSDGLQQLALRYATHEPEHRFVGPLVSTLGDSYSLQQLEASLHDFLSSPRVNSRTDDDKTLVMARMVE